MLNIDSVDLIEQIKFSLEILASGHLWIFFRSIGSGVKSLLIGGPLRPPPDITFTHSYRQTGGMLSIAGHWVIVLYNGYFDFARTSRVRSAKECQAPMDPDACLVRSKDVLSRECDSEM